MKYQTILLLLCLFMAFDSNGQRKIQVSSPDGKIVCALTLVNKKPAYTIHYDRKPVMENSPIGFVMDNQPFDSNLHFLKPQYRDGIEEYELIVGKAGKIKDSYREVIIPLEDVTKKMQVNVVIRAFNDGLAMRYEFVRAHDPDSLLLNDEQTTFNFPKNTVVHALPLPNFTSSHEGYYTTATIGELEDGILMDTPALFELPNSVFVAVTEASLVDFAGMYLTVDKGELRNILSPLPSRPGLKVKALLPHKSPWRVWMIGSRVGTLIESNILTDLSEPQAIKDVSWIRPGKTTFPWWNGNIVPDTLNAPGNNFVTQQYYIDFCARNGIEYHTVVEYGLHQWYVDDGVGFAPGPHSDPTRAVPGLDMKEVCDYAKSKGVGVRVWVYWSALYPKLDSAFAIYEKWGLSGMMVDFMDRDDQEMVNIQNEILRKAAEHHLHIQFHGAYHPTGLNRTYPNEYTREGTLNYEINKWDPHGLPADHDIMIPFTRMLAGSTDYHLGGFRAVPEDKYRTQYSRPLMRGTRAHMLAMYVVLENYLGMVCDYPDAYEGQPGFDFLKDVPTVWDETKVIDAHAGKYIAIARRKGNDWYVGGLTDHSPRSLDISFAFLPPGSYEATLYSDVVDAGADPNQLHIKKMDATSASTIKVPLKAGGGMAIHIRRK